MTIKKRSFQKGIILKPDTDVLSNIEGELKVDSADSIIKTTLGASARQILTNDQTQTIENKTIDSADNTITVDADEATVSNLEVDNLKAGVLDTDLNTVSISDDTIPSAKAVKTYVDAQIATVNEASEISYDNVGSGLTATNVQDAIDEVEGRLETAEGTLSSTVSALSAHINDVADAHDASAISNVPTGNLSATDVQGALNELQSSIDTSDTGLSNHINDPTDAHDASAISNAPSGNLVATDVQGALNELQTDVDTRVTGATLSTHTSASADVHGLSGGAVVVGTTSSQTLTNKIIQGASIQTPIRLDAKQDTYVNLVTYALTASNGQFVYATDLKQMFQVKDGLLVEVGGGGGGLDVLYTDDFENANAFVTGNGTPAAGGGGSFNGTLSDETSAPISGDQSLKYVMGASSTNDFFLNDADIETQEKQQNNWLGINFYYTYNGTDDDMRFFVLDQSDVELTVSTGTQQAFIKAQSTATRFSCAVYIPDGTTGIRYGWKVVTGNSAKIFIVDDLEISTNPFVYKDLEYVNSIALTGNDARSITASTEDMYFSGTATGWTSGVDGTASTYTVQKSDSVINLAFSIYYSGGIAGTIALYKNGSLYKRVADDNASSRHRSGAFLSKKGEFVIGDLLSLRNVAATGTLTNDVNNHWITIVERATSEHVVTPALNNINSISLAGSDSRAITATTESIYWTGSGTGWTTGVDGSTPTNGNYYTVQKANSIVILQGAIDNSGGGWSGSLRLYKNGSSYKILSENTTDRGRSFSFNSRVGEFAVGDKLAFVVSAGITVNNTAIDHYLNIVEIGDAKMLSAVPLLEQPQFLTTEHWTGKIWNDGKRIYRKTIAGSYANGATLLTGVDRLISSGGITALTGSVHRTFPVSNGATNSFPDLNPSTGVVTHFSDATYTLDIWIEYTKD